MAFNCRIAVSTLTREASLLALLEAIKPEKNIRPPVGLVGRFPRPVPLETEIAEVQAFREELEKLDEKSLDLSTFQERPRKGLHSAGCFCFTLGIQLPSKKVFKALKTSKTYQNYLLRRYLDP